MSVRMTRRWPGSRSGYDQTNPLPPTRKSKPSLSISSTSGRASATRRTSSASAIALPPRHEHRLDARRDSDRGGEVLGGWLGFQELVEGGRRVQRVGDGAPPGAGQAGELGRLLVIVGRGQDDQLGQAAGGLEGVVLVGAAAVGQQDDDPAPG